MTDTAVRSPVLLTNDAPIHRRMMVVPQLSEFEERILRFEQEHPEASGKKHATMTREFGLSSRQYRHELLRAVEAPAALDRFPDVVRRCLCELELGANETLWSRTVAS